MYIKCEGMFELEPKFATKEYGDITGQVVEDLIVCALEGGIDYWAGLCTEGKIWSAKSKGIPLSLMATELLLTGKSLTLYDIESGFGETPLESWDLTLDKLLEGIRLNKEEYSEDCDLEDFDANTADRIIQLALFGEIVYN